MDYTFVWALLNRRQAGMPAGYEKTLQEFRETYCDSRYSSSKCSHLGQGWFITYDYPPAEVWARSVAEQDVHHVWEEPDDKWQPTLTPYTLIHFTCPRREMEMKLRWC